MSTAVTAWYASTNTDAKPTRQDNITVTKYLASASAKPSGESAVEKRKRRKKESGSGSESYSSSSESNNEDDTKKKKKKDGKKKGRCWKGYKPTPGVEPYAPGSCQKA
jgi:hypothetical protein